MKTIRRDAPHGAEPAQRRLRSSWEFPAPVPSVLPSAASPEGKTEVIFKLRSNESFRAGRLGTRAVRARTRSARPQARLPGALQTAGIHLKIAPKLSNEVGPPHYVHCRWSLPSYLVLSIRKQVIGRGWYG